MTAFALAIPDADPSLTRRNHFYGCITAHLGHQQRGKSSKR